MFFCNRLDTWESEQGEWSETVKVLRHHQASLSGSSSSAAGMPTKKRKVELEAAAAGSSGNCAFLIAIHCFNDTKLTLCCSGFSVCFDYVLCF